MWIAIGDGVPLCFREEGLLGSATQDCSQAELPMSATRRSSRAQAATLYRPGYAGPSGDGVSYPTPASLRLLQVCAPRGRTELHPVLGEPLRLFLRPTRCLDAVGLLVEVIMNTILCFSLTHGLVQPLGHEVRGHNGQNGHHFLVISVLLAWERLSIERDFGR